MKAGSGAGRAVDSARKGCTPDLVNRRKMGKAAKLLKRRGRFGKQSLPVILSNCGKLKAIITK
jgi:hypothetical protein